MARQSRNQNDTHLIRTVLEPLCEAGSELRPAIYDQRMVIVYRRGGVSLAKRWVLRQDIERLLDLGYVRRNASKSDHYVITLNGEIAVRNLRKLAPSRRDGTVVQEVDPITGIQRSINPRESTLAWLARRKKADGKPFIDAQQFLAGERFRQDFTIAGLSPRITVDWTRFGAGQASGIGHPGLATDGMMAARQRLHAALDALGPDLAGIALDLCCFLKGIGEVERQRGLKHRTARHSLIAALNRLVQHYGFAIEGRPESGQGIVAWAEP